MKCSKRGDMWCMVWCGVCDIPVCNVWCVQCGVCRVKCLYAPSGRDRNLVLQLFLRGRLHSRDPGIEIHVLAVASDLKGIQTNGCTTRE